MANYNISINSELAEIVEKEMKIRRYSNKSEFFRDLVRERYLKESQTFEIDELEISEPDYQLLKEREKNAEFVSIKDVLKNKNV